jgi:hypothetical protein
MKKFFIVSMAGLFFSTFLYIVGCNSKGSPVTTTLPNVTFTVTPTPPVFPLLYGNGNFATVYTATDPFSGGTGGGAAGFPTYNSNDRTIGGYGGDNTGFLVEWTSTEVAAMGTYSGISLVGSSLNFSGFITCTFWAKANQTATVGFNAAEPAGDTGNVPENLTTTWTQYTINIVPGSRTDTATGAINAVTTYFVCVITTPGDIPGSTPLKVSIDDITFQTGTPSPLYNGTSGTLTSVDFTAQSFAVCCGSGQTGANMTFNLQGTAFPDTPNTYAMDFDFLSFPGSTYMGEQITSNGSFATGSFSTCTFYAKSNRAMTSGNVIEFNATGNNISSLASSYPGSVAAGSNLAYIITPSYAQYTIPLGASIAAAPEVFNVVINTGDVTDLGTNGALDIEIDNLQLQ